MRKYLKFTEFFILWLSVAGGISACGGSIEKGEIAMTYQQALDRTDPSKFGTVKRGSLEEAQAIEQFKDLFAVMSEKNLRDKVRNVYAEKAFLNDTLQTHYGVDAIEAYFVRTARAAEEITVQFTDVAESQGNYYFRWTMDIRFRDLQKGKTTHSIGISHVRFDPSGKVVLHQDYWDSAAGFLEHVPVLGSVIRWIKGRL